MKKMTIEEKGALAVNECRKRFEGEPPFVYVIQVFPGLDLVRGWTRESESEMEYEIFTLKESGKILAELWAKGSDSDVDVFLDKFGLVPPHPGKEKMGYMTEIKWVDVAHMYSKSDIFVTNDRMEEFECSISVSIGYLQIHIPILRHLADMTEAEARELYLLIGGCQKMDPRWKTALYWWKSFSELQMGVNGLEVSPKAFHWLIQKGFDLFGLIESGQAIRKEAQNG